MRYTVLLVVIVFASCKKEPCKECVTDIRLDFYDISESTVLTDTDTAMNYTCDQTEIDSLDGLVVSDQYPHSNEGDYYVITQSTNCN